MSIRNEKFLFALTGLLIAGSAGAATYSDNFQGKSASLNWKNLGDACLTAGDGTGSIPACGKTYQGGLTYTVPADETQAGQGALMLTPPLNSQTGAILSGFPPFALSEGIAITFTTYTFGGDSGGLARNGADGITFFLTDGTQSPPTKTGAEGGSMGYDCSNGNGVYDGIAYGYLGLGIDEYGNFLNTGDNGTNPQKSPTSFNGGIYNSNDPSGSVANGTNGYYNSNNGTITAGSGPQYQPERIGLRGAGNTNWTWLQSKNSSYYSGSSNAGMVQTACRTGQYVSGTDLYGNLTYARIAYNYDAIPGGYAVLPNSQPIANNSKSATRNPTPTTAQANIAWPITYKLTISPSGLLNFNYSYNNGAYQPVMANFDITKANGPLPASLRFGFSAGTGGSNNVHEIACFTAAPLAANSSAGSNTVTGKVAGNTQFFLASYSADNWWGSLVADPLVISGGNLSVGTNANWDAKCKLTGGLCDSMGLDASGKPIYNITGQTPASRSLLTSNAPGGSGNGVALQWANLSSAQQAALNKNKLGAVDSQGQQRVQWLQGVRSVEQLATPTPGTLRARTYVLGDIINSSPTFVGAPVSGLFPDTYTDQLYPAATNPESQSGAQKFGAYVSSNATRLNVVYVGGNDGYIHGFEAGNYDSSGNFVNTSNDGREVVGYMPYDVLLGKAVNLADPLYEHDYLVDASPGYSDLFYGNAWHTWLAGGVGPSGQEIYALDITNPTAMTTGTVMGDWDSSTLTHLGYTVGTPVIARMHNGQWALIFGSGLGSNGKSAGVYIGAIDSSGKISSFQFLDTGVGTAANPNGIAYVSSVDLDGDGIADYLYAGDTQGNVWRFDVTGSSSASWSTGSTPLFVAKDATGKVQPITTSITVLAMQTGTVTRDMLYFGTGQQTPATKTSATQYQKGPQTFYGIWDWNMNAWNGVSSSKYASLTAPQTVTRNSLLAQSVTSASDATHRYLSNTAVVCWQGDAATASCPSPNQYGWMFDLPDPGPTKGTNAGEGEQIIYNPTFIGGAIVVNTAIPPQISAAQCNPGLQSGWTMAFNPATGGGFPQNFFADAGGGFGGGNATVGGALTSGVGTPTSIQYGSQSYLVTQTVTGQAKLFPYSPYSKDTASRVSWQEIVTP